MSIQGVILGLTVLLSGTHIDVQETHPIMKFEEINAQQVSVSSKLSPKQAKAVISKKAKATVEAIKNKNMKQLKTMIHPDKGVRFSPYTYVDKKSDLVFKPSQIGKLPTSKTVYTWGAYDGSGNPIKATFNQYYRNFIYDRDYKNMKKVGYNQTIGKGNTVNNIRKVYPNSIVVEYYFGGTKKYSGMDWSSLKLVYEKKGSKWYLVGIVHDEWTI